MNEHQEPVDSVLPVTFGKQSLLIFTWKWKYLAFIRCDSIWFSESTLRLHDVPGQSNLAVSVVLIVSTVETAVWYEN
jgi:hypothetical protein